MSATAKTLAENTRTSTKARIKRASALARQQMNRFDRETLEQLDQIYRRAIDDLQEIIRSHAGPDGNLKLQTLQQLLNQSQQRLGQLNVVRDSLLNNSISTASSVGVSPFVGEFNDSILSRIADEAVQFTNNFIGADGLQLSDRIWRVNNHASQIVGDAINNAVIQGHGASQAANDFLSRGQPVPSDVNAKINMASADGVAKSVGRELMASGSPRSNAMRLFRTEINRAHGEAYMMTGEDHPEFAGWKFLLSPRHPEADICDMHARANLYGLGPGVYPSRKRNPWPAHPNTLSYTEIVFIDEVSAADKAGKISRLDWLKGQLPRVQEKVLNSRRKRAALTRGFLRENEIATPWNVLKKRYARRGIDVDALKPAIAVKPAQIKGTIITGMDATAFAEYSEAAFKYAPKDIRKLIEKVRKPSMIEVVKSGGSWYQGDKIHLSLTSMTSRKGFHSMHDVYRHEYGHFVDYWLKAKNNTITSPVSSVPGHLGGLKTVIDKTRKALRSNSKNQILRRGRINKDLISFMDTNLADLFGALTNNRVGWGHSVKYLSRPGFKETEIFANLFDAYSRNDPGAWNFIKAELPDLANEFVVLIQREAR